MTKPIRRILVTNDDGINAPGLECAYKIACALSDDVWVVAPAEEQSGASHSLSFTSPMRMTQQGEKKFAVGGTPTDCVMIATRSILRDNPPQLVLSGVNAGQNIAEDISYSGTVSAAKEGTVIGIRSVALSQAIAFDGSDKPNGWEINFGVAERHGAGVVEKLLTLDWPPDTLMNVNFPAIGTTQPCGVNITQQGKRDALLLQIEKRIDPRGSPYYWYGFNRARGKPPQGTDIDAIMRGKISITPLQMDHTNSDMKKELEKLFG